MTEKYPTHHKFNDLTIPFELDGISILPGENSVVKMNVGRLPSDNKIHITAHVFRSRKPGPTLLLLAGVHGDEINGIESLRSMVENGIFENLIAGNVIVIPLLNVFGFINFSRDVPDGKDVNRSFPGSTSGSLASRVARVITKKVLPLVDIAIDLHTGGASRHNYPQVRYTDIDVRNVILAKYFNAPFSIRKATIPHSFRRVCKERKIPVIVYEGGESIRLNGLSIEYACIGITNVMSHLKMIKRKIKKSKLNVSVSKTIWLRSPYSGIFMWAKSSGDLVKKGELLGTIKDPYGTKEVKVPATRSGYVIGHNNASVVNHGDALFHLAYEYTEND